jgi:DNA helicase HerA-like ATPase
MDFVTAINDAYRFKGPHIPLGVGVFENTPQPDVLVSLALGTLNRHGLISGATGTGKTKTLQMLSEQLSRNGVPVMLMDLKGDLAGLSTAGTFNEIIESRKSLMKGHYPFTPEAFPVNFLSLGNDNGIPLRAKLQDFGSVLLSRILNLNNVQRGIIGIVFKYCNENGLPINTLQDLRFVLNQICAADEQIQEKYGSVSQASVATILRSISELEEQGAEKFIATPAFDIQDLIGFDESGRGRISIIGLSKIQDKPALFSTFILYLLTTIYDSMPEIGDTAKPKLALFIDEAHLLFNETGSAIESKIESIVKLIRSKGIAIIFCTQTPLDISEPVIGQLGFKIQHALRAFTPKDRKAIKQMAANFPESSFYDLEDEITQLPIGEAFVTVLNEAGAPTPVVRTLIAPPVSHMGPISEQVMAMQVKENQLYAKYSKQDTRSTETHPQLIAYHQQLLEQQRSKEEQAKRLKNEEKQWTKKATNIKTQNSQGGGLNPLLQMYSNMMAGNALHHQTNQPPIGVQNTVQYYYSNDGQRIGPYDIQQFKQLVASGMIHSHSYVWKTGMSNWLLLHQFSELNTYEP